MKTCAAAQGLIFTSIPTIPGGWLHRGPKCSSGRDAFQRGVSCWPLGHLTVHSHPEGCLRGAHSCSVTRSPVIQCHPHCAHSYLDNIEQAISEGDTLLIENIGETVDPVLDPLLGRNTIRKGK